MTWRLIRTAFYTVATIAALSLYLSLGSAETPVDRAAIDTALSLPCDCHTLDPRCARVCAEASQPTDCVNECPNGRETDFCLEVCGN